MNDGTLTQVGLVSLGALIALVIFLTVIVVLGARVVRWLMGAGFRFADFEAHQTDQGVKMNSAFKRAGFSAAPQKAGFTKPTAPADPAPAFFDVKEPEQFDEMTAIADEDMQANTRVSIGSAPGHVQIAIATESDVGFTMHRVSKGKEVRLRVPRTTIQPGAPS